jgi:GNAT superfamily N-acetyltransferase
MYKIVEFKADRSSELAVLNRQLIVDEGLSNSMSAIELEKRMSQWLSNEYESYGIEHEGKIICYSLWRDNGDYHYMRQLYTVPEYRRQGIAKSLVLHMVQNHYSNKPVRLDVLEGNSDARISYEEVGFRIYCHTMMRKN